MTAAAVTVTAVGSAVGCRSRLGGLDVDAPLVASIVTSLKVTEVTPETLKAAVPGAVLRVIVPPLPPNVTPWLGSSWLAVLAPLHQN